MPALCQRNELPNAGPLTPARGGIGPPKDNRNSKGEVP
jgi:hypothetical protein